MLLQRAHVLPSPHATELGLFYTHEAIQDAREKTKCSITNEHLNDMEGRAGGRGMGVPVRSNGSWVAGAGKPWVQCLSPAVYRPQVINLRGTVQLVGLWWVE